MGEITSSDDLLTVYPNPGDRELRINFPSVSGDEVRIQVFDSMGRLVISQVSISQAGNSEFVLDTSMLEAGSYGVRVQSGTQIFRSTWLHR